MRARFYFGTRGPGAKRAISRVAPAETAETINSVMNPRIQDRAKAPLIMSKNSLSGLALIGVGTMLTSMIVAGFVLGYGVDKWLDSRPVFMLLFGALGAVGGFLKVYKLLSRGI